MLSNYPVRHSITTTGIDEPTTGGISLYPQKLEAFRCFSRDSKVHNPQPCLYDEADRGGLKTRMFFSVNTHGRISTVLAFGQMLLQGDEHLGLRPAGLVTPMMMTYLMESQAPLLKRMIQTIGDLCGLNNCSKVSARSLKNLLYWII